ncbi:hypothetical protein Tco_0224369 [Tanacetum coccineum]
MYRIASSITQTRAPQLNQTYRNTNPRVSTSTGVSHKTNVSRPQPRSNQMKDKVVPNTSHVKFKKTEVEEHPRIRIHCHNKKTVASESTVTNSKSYYRMLYKKTNKAWKWWIAQQCPSAYKWVPKTKMKWVPKVRNESVTKKVSSSKAIVDCTTDPIHY